MTKRMLVLVPLLALLAAPGVHAQLYKWVGPDGKITYSDTPPPSKATRVEAKSLSDNVTSTADFPYELAEATKNHPVTLYTTDNCAPCEDGRKLLNSRGIPFKEKTVTTSEDMAKLRQLDNQGSIPLLVVGRNKERGFLASAWNSALTTAGYPQTSRLPKSYRQAPAQATAPVPASEQKTSANAVESQPAESRAAALPPPTGNAPPGFRF